MTNHTVINVIQTARRDALVDYYTNYCIPQTTLEDGTSLDQHVKSAEELYEYLLLDTRIGPEIVTSRVAEAISSLQLYINRCLGGIDPDVNNTVGSNMVEESKPGGFLYDWPDYNQVFSTWAGKERLQYYPSSYLDPGLRYNKTELFKALEETINQGRISDSRVETGFQQYLLGFETLANLETISGYQAGLTASDDCKDTLYFIGRTSNAPYSYYWRSYNMAVRDDNDQATAGAWSQWLKISAPASEAVNNIVKPCWYNNRLYICWISKTESGAIGSGIVTPSYEYFSNIWYLAEDGAWVSNKKTKIPAIPFDFALVNDLSAQEQKFYYFSESSAPKNNVIYSDLTYPQGRVKVGDEFSMKGGAVAKVTGLEDLFISFAYSGTLFVSCYDYDGYLFDSGPANGGKYTLQDKAKFIRITDLNDGSSFETLYVFSSYAKNIAVPVSGAPFYLDNERVVWGVDYLSPLSETSKYMLTLSAAPQTIAHLVTKSAPFFCELLQKKGVDGILKYTTQTTPLEFNNTIPIDFNGPYGLYFWEIFFHSCFLIADRYLTEQNYARSELWHKYVFSPSGYRNNDGLLETADGETRYWNVVPLQTDQTWNSSIPKTVDPDVIAMNDPMHYKVAFFLSYMNTLIEHGDSCYRMQQRDYISQAKMYYIQASQILGPRPDINYTNSWSNPTVGMEVSARSLQSANSIDLQSSNALAMLFKAHLNEDNGSFLPPYNADLLTYWDKLEVRLFNLRNNLTLDGQPMVLPLYATPVSPTELQQQHGAGNGTASVSIPGNQLTSEFRFPVLMDKARTAVSSVIQFGNALQSALQQRDSEYMTLLVQTQQQQISALTQEVQVDNIASLTSGVAATTQALESAKSRLGHYNGLYNNWISSSEQSAMDLRVAAGALNTSSLISNVVGAAVELAPNTFGLACGGSRWGGAARAVAFGLQAAATILETSAQRLDISEQYRRRRSDWQIQKETADFEVKQLTAQIQSQNQQLAMAQKQRGLYAQELSNLRAQYALQSNRFTGLELFNWMAGRLSSLYYQLYDSALALCLTTKAALGREIGASNTATLFTTPMWNDLYQGLLAGESLQLELQKMENTFLRMDQRGLEIQKTVSLNTQITQANSSSGFSALLTGALQDMPVATTGGVTVQMLNTDKLVITLDIASLGLNGAYGSTGKVGRFKNISITLPALLGPYQDVEATLSLGTKIVALSRGLDDSGMFMVDFNDPKYLPFEGDLTNTGTLVLTFFNAGTDQRQRAVVKSLVDVIFQLRYTLKGR